MATKRPSVDFSEETLQARGHGVIKSKVRNEKKMPTKNNITSKIVPQKMKEKQSLKKKLGEFITNRTGLQEMIQRLLQFGAKEF